MYGNGLTVPIESDYRLKDIQDVNDYFNMNVKKGIRNKESNHDYDVMFFAYATYEDLTLNVVDKPRIIDAEFIEKQEKEIKEPTFREHPLIQEFDSIFHSAFFKEDDEK